MMKRNLGFVLSFILTAEALCVSAGAGVRAGKYSDSEIEKRIDEVGEQYIDFYRRGRGALELEMDSAAAGGPLLGFNGLQKNASAVAEDGAADYAFDDAVYEEAAEYEAYEAPDSGYELLRTQSGGDFGAAYHTEEYAGVEESGFISTKTQPFSTFGADVDTASYSSLRRKLLEPYAYGDDPYYYGIDDSAIRVEEMINYFPYSYNQAEDDEKFGVTTALCPCPWNGDTLLLKVGIRAEDLKEELRGSNIVFLIDTSGSMFDFDKLPLVKKSLEILTDNLDERDSVSIVTYAGSEEVILEGASGDEKERILSAVNGLEAWGSTYGEGGINKAYEIAEKHYIDGGNNRVILCTDGDFNVGTSSEAGLKELISRKRQSGIFFSCLGFGEGNYSDTTMETLADNGNGNYFYIDCEREADRALNKEFFSTVYTAAKDTKFQVEFNPATVKGYRLIGYENRRMAAEDFADDTKDGGEVGAGQCVTVLYEVVPVSSGFEITEVPSRYGKEEESADGKDANIELLSVSIRYKDPGSDESVLREYQVSMNDLKEEMDADTSWAAGVAQAGMLLRDSKYAGTSTFDGIYQRLKEDPEIMDNDYKAEFLFMLRAMKKYKAA